jgi:hypothetical protein
MYPIGFMLQAIEVSQRQGGGRMAGEQKTARRRKSVVTKVLPAPSQQPVRLLGAAQGLVGAAAVILAFGAPIWAALLMATVLYMFDELKARRVTPVGP